MTNLRRKLITVFFVLVVFAGVGVYPIAAERYGLPSPGWLQAKRLKLGLDLRGGVHLVLRVRTEDALKNETELTMERLREALARASISVANITRDAIDFTRFRVEGVPSDKDAAFRTAAAEVEVNFDRNSGSGGTYVFTMRPTVEAALREDTIEQARQTIERRVNELGVAEPSIARQGSTNDQILVQLPGVTDVDRAKEIIRNEGFLELKLVEKEASTKEELMPGGVAPTSMDVIPGVSASGDAGPYFYLVRKVAPVNGRDLRSARPTLDENNRPAVSFTLSSDGGARFGKFTSENLGRRLAIVLDGRVQSAPTIEGRITTDGRIYGSFTPDEAADLALILRSGALPAGMDYLQEQTIGPSLGADSIRSGVMASLVGLLLIIIFMLWYYKLSGVNAVVALLFNLVILLGLMAYMGAVMTLPGIAGFILTIGLGVDSNVLIFERIKEELDAQKGVRAAINAGFSRVFLTLVDTHIAGFIAAAFLFQFGTGAIRGFAVTLSIGLVSNLFTSTFVSKSLFELVLARRQQVTTLSI
jgi:preprotein translocase subunit SecD